MFRSILEASCRAFEETGDVFRHDWAEVHRLHHVEGMSKSAIAVKLSMSRNTVARLLSLAEPPKHRRRRARSQVDRFGGGDRGHARRGSGGAGDSDRRPVAPAGVHRLVEILKDHLRRVRPSYTAATAYQRTTYLPGEVALTDWWHTGVRVPVGRGQVRPVFRLVNRLPFSAAPRVESPWRRRPWRFARRCWADWPVSPGCRRRSCRTMTPRSSPPAGRDRHPGRGCGQPAWPARAAGGAAAAGSPRVRDSSNAGSATTRPRSAAASL